MKIAVISDLHLGGGGRVDRFGHADSTFLRFLSFLEGSFERIVLLGDVFELLHGGLPGSFSAQLQKVRAAHPAIFERFRRPPYTYIHGNHDLASRKLLGAPQDLLIDADGARLLFVHGHQADWIVRSLYPLAVFTSWVGGMIERLLGPLIARRLDDVDNWLLSARRVGPCPFQGWAVAQAVRARADVVVTAHTHLPLVAEHGDRLYMNSGTCSRGRFNFLSIDTRAGAFTVQEQW